MHENDHEWSIRKVLEWLNHGLFQTTNERKPRKISLIFVVNQVETRTNDTENVTIIMFLDIIRRPILI
jgi:hypothetical protein